MASLDGVRRSGRLLRSRLSLSFAAFFMALLTAWDFSSSHAPYYCNLAHWIRSASFQVDFSFYLDQLSLVMLLVVTGVGFLIHIYSVGYPAIASQSTLRAAVCRLRSNSPAKRPMIMVASVGMKLRVA